MKANLAFQTSGLSFGLAPIYELTKGLSGRLCVITDVFVTSVCNKRKKRTLTQLLSDT